MFRCLISNYMHALMTRHVPLLGFGTPVRVQACARTFSTDDSDTAKPEHTCNNYLIALTTNYLNKPSTYCCDANDNHLFVISIVASFTKRNNVFTYYMH